MKKYKIACDVDDVLLQCYPAICKHFNKPERYIDIWDAEIENAWVNNIFPPFFNELEFWKNIPKLSNPESINFKIDHYITSIPAHLHDIREECLLKHGFPKKPLVCTLGNKVDTMKALGINVLIDDKPSTIKKVREAGLIGIQFVPPYMRNYDKNDPFTIKHLSQVPEILNKYC